jgi:hypothetical protein
MDWSLLGQAKTYIHVHIAQKLLARNSSRELISLRLSGIRYVGVRDFVRF